jgi:glycerol-3-phosphate dehydrogenase (NAD(P)+)
MNCTVIGAGSWGTALAIQLARNGHSVMLWDHNAARSLQMQQERENKRYLPGILFPDAIQVSSSKEAVRDTGLVCVVVPSQVIRSVMGEFEPLISSSSLVVCASKGIEVDSLKTMDEVLKEVLPEHPRVCALSGPSFAREVAIGLPTAVVMAGLSVACAEEAAAVFHGGYFRVYHSDDLVGVELGGAVKNVLAIACGAVDGAGLGTNARAALITRGLNEISRLAVARGANPLTLMGLAGVGDLVLTCTGDLSRNRRVGLALGQGKKLPEILKELGQVAEGVVTTKSTYQLAQKLKVEMPITEQIYKVLYEEKPLADGLKDLFGRGRKAERG